MALFVFSRETFKYITLHILNFLRSFNDDSCRLYKYMYVGSIHYIFSVIYIFYTLGNSYYDKPIILNFIRNVQIYTPPRYSTTNNFPIFYLRDQTFFKDITSKSSRLYQCSIIEDDLNPGDAWMYMMTNSSSQKIDLRYFSYKYVRYGFQTELYAIVKDPSYVLDDAYCITTKDRSGYEINKKD